MTDIDITTTLDIRDLAEIIGDSGLSHDELLEFIFLLDANVADWDFTIKLRDALTADIPKDVQADHDLSVKEAERRAKWTSFVFADTGADPFPFYDFTAKN